MVRTEEAATRQAAAGALVALFVAGDATVRLLSAQGILLVDDPKTPALIEAANACRQFTDRDLYRLACNIVRRFAGNRASGFFCHFKVPAATGGR